MDQLNNATVQRVWKRVQGQGGDSIGQLLTEEAELAAIYHRLSGQLPQHKKSLFSLTEAAQRHRHCLQGILRLSQGKSHQPPSLPPRQETQQGLLCKAYNLLTKTANTCLRLSQEPEYGSVFAQIAKQKQEQSLLLLEILGAL